MTEKLSKDLQLTIQETPGMTAALPWRVFKVTDCDWWIARTLSEAIEDCKRQTGMDEELAEARELSEAELDRLKYIEGREQPRSKWVRRTFREELARRAACEWEKKPGMFASTEY